MVLISALIITGVMQLDAGKKGKGVPARAKKWVRTAEDAATGNQDNTELWRMVRTLNGRGKYARIFPGTAPFDDREKVEEIGRWARDTIKRWGWDLPPFINS